MEVEIQAQSVLLWSIKVLYLIYGVINHFRKTQIYL